MKAYIFIMTALEGVLERVGTLRKDLDSKVILQHRVTEEVMAGGSGGYGHNMRDWDYAAGDSWVPRETVVIQPEITVAGKARSELKEIYKNSEHREARRNAGVALRYSELRIWAHENPIVASLVGLSGLGALAYFAMDFLNK